MRCDIDPSTPTTSDDRDRHRHMFQHIRENSKKQLAPTHPSLALPYEGRDRLIALPFMNNLERKFSYKKRKGPRRTEPYRVIFSVGDCGCTLS